MTELDAALSRAEFIVEQRFGGWYGEPFTEASAEIITTAVAS